VKREASLDRLLTEQLGAVDENENGAQAGQNGVERGPLAEK